MPGKSSTIGLGVEQHSFSHSSDSGCCRSTIVDVVSSADHRSTVVVNSGRSTAADFDTDPSLRLDSTADFLNRTVMATMTTSRSYFSCLPHPS